MLVFGLQDYRSFDTSDTIVIYHNKNKKNIEFRILSNVVETFGGKLSSKGYSKL